MRRKYTGILSILAVSVLLLVYCSTPAYAVIPALGPLIPQIILLISAGFIFIAAGFAALFSLKWWRMKFARLLSARLRTKIIIGATVLVVIGTGVAALVIYGRWTTGRYGLMVTEDQEQQTTGQSWPAFRGGLMRTGNNDGQPGPEVGEEVWVFRDLDFRSGNFSSSPAVIGKRVYVGSSQSSIFASGGVVYCLNAESGEMIWKYQTVREIFSSPAVANGKVYIGEGLHQDVDSKLYCLDAATGSFLWSFQTSSHVESSPAVVDGKVYFGGGVDGVYCVDAETGEQIWHYPGIHVDISPAVDKGNVYVGTGYGDTSIYCLDADTGAQNWQIHQGYPVWGSPSILSDRVYFGIGNGNFLESDEEPYGKVICVDTTTLETVWQYEVDDSVLTAVALSDGRVYFGSRDGNVYCLDADSGEFKWKWQTESPVLSSPAVDSRFVYFGSDNGVIYCVDKLSGQLKWEYDTTITAPDGTKIFSSPAVANNRLYVGSSKFFFFCIGKWE